MSQPQARMGSDALGRAVQDRYNRHLDRDQQLSLTKINAILSLSNEEIFKALEGGSSVTLNGIGTLRPVVQAARIGRHPRTKEPMDIPASKGLRFKQAKKAKELLN